jgi:hypothetical protein
MKGTPTDRPISEIASFQPATAGRRGDSLDWLDFDAWDELIDREVLIDLGEWAEALGYEPLAPYRCAFTSELWTLLERIPFSEIGRTSIDERVRAVHCCASRALERALLNLRASRISSQIEIAFGVPISSVCALRATVSKRVPLTMIVGRAQLDESFEKQSIAIRLEPGRPLSSGPDFDFSSGGCRLVPTRRRAPVRVLRRLQDSAPASGGSAEILTHWA